MRDLVILGAGGYGREVLQVVRDVNRDASSWNLLGFLDADANLHGGEIKGLPVLGDVDWLQRDRPPAVAVAVGSPAGRWRAVERLASVGHDDHATLVHPAAWLGDDVGLGRGSIVLAGVTASIDITIGAYACLNKNCVIGHDARLGDFVTISPGASISGFVTVGEGADVGANSVIVQGNRLGDWAVLGAGAVMCNDVPADAVAVGVPARVSRARDAGWQRRPDAD
ncbi:MAG: acetyltransferase [Actinobacteria bacterium]|nr:acetyltransferase [Actinomycetota bacterium]